FMHLANHGGKNVGNAALVLGLERILREDLPFDVSFLREPWDLYTLGRLSFDERFVERVNAECDVLLVGAAVSFDGQPSYASTGFRFDLPPAPLDRIERPIVFYGLSYRSGSPTYSHADALKRAMEHILSRERILFSVRNDGTKHWLEGMIGFGSERIVEVPDPAVFVPVEDGVHLELAAGKANVIFAGNAEDEVARFGGRRVERERSIGWRRSE